MPYPEINGDGGKGDSAGMKPVGDPYESVIKVLLQHGMTFRQSDEYRELEGNGEDLPGVVTCAYARYVGRLIRDGSSMSIDDLIYPLNILSSWNDKKVDTVLLDEAVEQLDADGTLHQLDSHASDRFLKIIGLYRSRE